MQAITRATQQDWIGLSTETKPTGLPVGSSFFETDTRLLYLFDGTGWYQAPIAQVSGPVAVTGPLTDTQLRATAVPISIDQTTPGTTNAVVSHAVAAAAVADRSAIAAADVVAVPGTVTCTKEAGGSAGAGTYTVFVVAGNTYGRTTAKQGDTTVTTETTNLTVRAAFTQVTGATFYDLYMSTDGAAAKFVGRITEAQRATGIKLTAVNVTGAGGTAGAVDIEVTGTGLAVNAGHLATNTAYTPESLTAVDPGNSEYCDVNVTVARSGDSVAASVVLIPFYAGSSGYWAGDPVPLAFGGVASAYESLRQTLRLPVRGRQFVIVVAAIAGTGTTVTTEVVTS